MSESQTPEGAMVMVPPNVLEAIAHNLCSLHDFDPAFVAGQERFARAVITEYERAMPTPDFSSLAATQQSPISGEGAETTLLSAAKKVMEGLLERIDTAPENAVPVFDGIVDLHDAIHRYAPPVPSVSGEGGR